MPEINRDFRPPQSTPSHTGTLWRNADGSLGIFLTDVFNVPIHLIGTKDGDTYHVRGWRGEPPEFLRLPLAPRDDGLPDDAPRGECATCHGRLYWRASIVSNPAGGGIWQCATCAPYDPLLWVDALAVPGKAA